MSSSDSSSEEEKPAPKKVAAPVKAAPKKVAKDSSSESSSEEEKPAPKKAAAPAKAAPAKAAPKKVESSSDSSSEEEKPAPTPEEMVAPAEKPSESDSQDYILIPGEDSKSSIPASTPSPAVEEKTQEKPVPALPQVPKGKTPAGRPLDAPILIEKSGLQEEAGYEPPTKSLFGGFMKRYRYLTPSVRKAIDNAKVQRGRWKYIIVHNSGTRQGNARIFENYHRKVRKMQNGLAYHFVIGNGNSSGNGQIEIGSRWTRQINGGHVASDYLNDISLGICLVGDLNRDLPTKDQLGALDELCSYLRDRVGKVKGRPAIVKGHKEINPKPTDCPGDRFPLGWLRKRFGG